MVVHGVPDLLHRGELIGGHRDHPREVQRIQTWTSSRISNPIGRRQARSTRPPDHVAVHADDTHASLGSLQEFGGARVFEIPSGAGVNDTGLIEQFQRGEHALLIRIKQVISRAIHHLESHLFQVGSYFLGSDHAPAERAIEMGLVPNQRLEIAEADIRVPNNLQRSLQRRVLELRSGPDNDQIANARKREGLVDLHLHVLGPVAGRYRHARVLEGNLTHDYRNEKGYRSRDAGDRQAPSHLKLRFHPILLRVRSPCYAITWITPTFPSISIFVPNGCDNFCSRCRIRRATSADAIRGTPRFEIGLVYPPSIG